MSVFGVFLVRILPHPDQKKYGHVLRSVFSIHCSNAIQKILICIKHFCELLPFFFAIRRLKLKEEFYNSKVIWESDFPDAGDDDF